MLTDELKKIGGRKLVVGRVLDTLGQADQRPYMDQSCGHRDGHRTMVPVHDSRNIIRRSWGEKNRRNRGHNQQENEDLGIAPHAHFI
jgi:hypothetical protein